MIITQMGNTIDQQMVAVAWNVLYDTTRKSNQQPVSSIENASLNKS
jgi:hypothetical protein